MSLNTLEALGTAAHVSLSSIRPDESNKALILTTIARYEAQVSFLQSLFKRYPSSKLLRLKVTVDRTLEQVKFESVISQPPSTKPTH